jgi:hypothetical protein
MADTKRTPEQVLKDKQEAMSDLTLIGFAEEQITELARTGGRSHKMCVPPNITDTDMLFSELVRRFKKLTSANKPESLTLEDVKPTLTLIAKCFDDYLEKLDLDDDTTKFSEAVELMRDIVGDNNMFIRS